MVDFKDPGLQVWVKHDVKTEDFKTHRVFYIIWLATSIDVWELWLDCTYSLYYDSTDISLNLLHIVSFLSKVTPNKCQTSFMPDAIVIFAFVLNKLWTVFIYGIISKMHVKVI